MESSENSALWCDFVASVYSRITNIYNEILEHENLLQNCKMCQEDVNHLPFIKDQIYVIVRINLQLNDEKIEYIEEDLEVLSHDDNTQEDEMEEYVEELVYVPEESTTLDTQKYLLISDYNNINDQFTDLGDNNQIEIVQTQNVECSEDTEKPYDQNEDVANDKHYSCALCDVKFTQKCNLAQHMIWHSRIPAPRRKNKEVKFNPKWKEMGKSKCKLCKGIYKQKHECKSLGGPVFPQFTCTYCSEKFSTYRKIYDHHKVEHPNDPKPISPYQCEICGVSVSRQSTLKRHMMFHTDNYPHTCDLCDKKFRTSQKMKEHRQTHLPKDERDIKHKCKLCGKRFYSTTTLKTHISLKHEERETFKCDICGREFLKDLSLKRHLIIHDGETGRRHKCDICGMTFNSSRYRKQHRKRKHDIID